MPVQGSVDFRNSTEPVGIGYNEFSYGLGFPFPFPTDNTEAICYRPSNGSVVINPMFNYLHSWNGSSYSSLNYTNSRSRGLAEDSQNRLWSLGENAGLSYYSDANQTWTPVTFLGTGNGLKKDPTLPGTVWACSSYEVLRTDGNANYSKVVDDFQELDPQSDVLTSIVPAANGISWVGSNKGLFKLDAANNTYQFFSPSNSAIPGENITPLAYSPDGILWFTNFLSIDTTRIGLCWFDGTQFGILPVESGGLPHAQIPDMEVKEVPNGYELWMSCLSRGIAVLNVITTPVGITQSPIPEPVIFFKNYPNPLTSITTLSFSLNDEGIISLAIFDISGRVVRDLITTFVKSGISHADWDGCDNQGNRVGSGIYTCRLRQGNYSKSILILVQ